jgi:hypothetical protein
VGVQALTKAARETKKAAEAHKNSPALSKGKPKKRRRKRPAGPAEKITNTRLNIAKL